MPQPLSDRPVPDFLPPAKDPRLPGYGYLEIADDTVSGYAEIWRIVRSPLEFQTRAAASGAYGSVYPWATIKYWEHMEHKAQDDDPARACVTGESRYLIERENRTVAVEGELSFTSDLENFYYTYTRRALENGKLIKEKIWKEAVPRDFQ